MPFAMEFNDAVAHLCSEEWESGAKHGTRFHEDVLSALLPASRTAEGRFTLGAIPGAIEAVTSVLKDPLVYLERIGLLAVRLLRNLCANSLPNQQRAADAKASHYVLSAITHRVSEKAQLLEDGTLARHSVAVKRIHDGEEPRNSTKLNLPFFTVAVEFLCNFATENSDNADLIWKQAYPETFFQILNCENRAAVSAGAALLHNCVAATPERASDLVQIWTEASGDGRSIAELLVKRLHNDDKNDKNESDSNEDEVFSWSFMVIQRLVAAGLVEDVFSVVGTPLPEIGTRDGSRFSPFQVTLLRILEAATSKAAEDSGRGEFQFAVPQVSLTFFSSLLIASWNVGDGEAFMMSCNIAGSVMLLSTPSEDLSQFKIASTSTALSALSTLHRQAPNNESERNSEQSNAYAGVKGAIIRLIGFACDRNRPVQDLVRRMNGIIPVLSALAYEKDVAMNPFLREWAVFAIRNLCYNNQEIADEIAKLELLDVQMNEDVLKAAGLEAFIDEATGRPHVRVKP